MKRPAFLRAAAGGIAAAAVPRLSPRALAEDVINVTLRSGAVAGGIAFNGTIPGPLLRVVHGQRIRVRYISGVEVPTSIHWHGMQVPNAMDGVAGITQAPVHRGETFVYEFVPGPPGTRWYHDHAFKFAATRGLFGTFIVDDPAGEPADREYVLVFHDVPNWRSLRAALRGVSTAAMMDPMGAPDAMHDSARMGDDVAYAAHCINGSGYPESAKYAVRAGERVRLRILNASPTQTRYVALAGHELLVTHADGNALIRPVAVDALRLGIGERYDVIVEFHAPGAFLLQGISNDALEMRQQAVVFYTEGMRNAAPLGAPAVLDGLRVSTYETLGSGLRAALAIAPPAQELVLGGGGWGNPRWTINDRIWPNTPQITVRRGDEVTLRFRNAGDMEHPMHVHGHTFFLTRVNSSYLPTPLRKDGSWSRRAAAWSGASSPMRRRGDGCSTVTTTSTWRAA